MDKSLISELHRAKALNLNLLELTAQEKWEEFIEGMTQYIVIISDAVALGTEGLSSAEQINVRHIMEKLLENEAVMTQRMRSRLDILHKDMAVINKGKTVSHAYAESFTYLPR